jgi:hypothetical protein
VDGQRLAETRPLFGLFGPDREETEKGVSPMEVEVGKVTHYYNHLDVAVLKLSDSVKL